MVGSDALDAAAVGSKIVRTADGVFLNTPSGGTVELDAGDTAELLPVGSVLRVTDTSPLTIESSIPAQGALNVPVKAAFTPQDAERVVTTDLTTVDDILGGLETWRTSFATPE